MSQLLGYLSHKVTAYKNLILTLKLAVAAYGYIFSHISGVTAVIALVFILFVRFFIGSPDCDLILTLFEKFGKSVHSLKGNVIWVTGASTGIGEAIAYELAKAKCKLVLSARSEDKLQNVKKRCMEIGSLSDNDVLVVAFDMTDYEKHQSAFSTVMTHFGKLDCLVSNAGRGQMALWQNIDVSVDKALFDLNVFSLLNLARIVTKHFISVGGGKHVIVSSAAAIMGNPFSSSYAASKYALNGYFEVLRHEKGNLGMLINMLCPGPVVSNIKQGLLYETLDIKAKTALRSSTLMTSERCAELAGIAMANNIKEAWISPTKILFYMYLYQYFPTFTKWLCHQIDLSAFYKKIDEN